MYRKKNAAIIDHLSRDPKMKQVIREVADQGKYRFADPSKKVYEDLVESIIYQQLSIKAAKTIYTRMVTKLGGSIPEPEVLGRLNESDLQGVGLSRQKEKYILNIARFFDEHKLETRQFRKMSDEEIIDLLTQIKGVGVWTVEMILISSLGRTDVLPLKDLGIQQAMAEIYQIQAEKKELFHQMTRVAEPWRPYRTHASLLLWRWKRIQMGLDY